MSRVIKASQNRERVVPAEAYDARVAARRLLADAEAQVDAARQQARREGHDAGRAEGLAAVTELLVAARAAAGRREDEAGPELRRLAVRIAEKILGRELAASPEATVVDLVRTALETARARRQLVVKVHPDDAAAVTEARPRLAAALAANAVLTVRPDATIPRGGCQIDTEVGTIDARLDAQLAAIERALIGDA